MAFIVKSKLLLLLLLLVLLVPLLPPLLLLLSPLYLHSISIYLQSISIYLHSLVVDGKLKANPVTWSLSDLVTPLQRKLQFSLQDERHVG